MITSVRSSMLAGLMSTMSGRPGQGRRGNGRVSSRLCLPLLGDPGVIQTPLLGTSAYPESELSLHCQDSWTNSRPQRVPRLQTCLSNTPCGCPSTVPVRRDLRLLPDWYPLSSRCPSAAQTPHRATREASPLCPSSPSCQSEGQEPLLSSGPWTQQVKNFSSLPSLCIVSDLSGPV